MNEGQNHTEVGGPNAAIKGHEPWILVTAWLNLRIITQSEEARHKRTQTV